ncbi:MAG: hypothetical protein AAGG08_04240 [Actinomycetota bacterium]
MTALSPQLRYRIVQRHHTVTRRELLADGVPQRDIERWVGARVLREVVPGVLALDDALRATPFETRAAALCLSGPDAVLDAPSSARILALPGAFRPGRPGLAVDRLDSAEVIERPDGLRILSAAATWFGMCALLHPAHARRWSGAVLETHVDLRDAHRVVRRHADIAAAGGRHALAGISSRRRWQRPGDPALERRLRSSLRRRGHVGLDGTHHLELPHGVVVYLTVADHRARWGVEIDHRRWHGGRWPSDTEAWIDRRIAAAGWTVWRVPDDRLRRSFAATMHDLAADHAMRLSDVG